MYIIFSSLHGRLFYLSMILVLHHSDFLDQLLRQGVLLEILKGHGFTHMLAGPDSVPKEVANHGRDILGAQDNGTDRSCFTDGACSRGTFRCERFLKERGRERVLLKVFWSYILLPRKYTDFFPWKQFTKIVLTLARWAHR